jgi:DNA-binding NarL/FixJ family response regulator
MRSGCGFVREHLRDRDAYTAPQEPWTLSPQDPPLSPEPAGTSPGALPPPLGLTANLGASCLAGHGTEGPVHATPTRRPGTALPRHVPATAGEGRAGHGFGLAPSGRSEGRAVRHLVVDDHPLVGEALGNVLRRIDADAEVETICDGARALEQAAVGREPDLVLLDLNMPGLHGINALKTWRSRYPAVPVIVLSAQYDPATVLAALGAGAAGFIPKSTPNDVMRGAIRMVLDGGRYLPPELLGPADGSSTAVVSPPARTRRPAPASLQHLGLTARQLDVFKLVGQGLSNKVICRELGLAERTVKAHVTAAMRVLGVSSRTQLALAAARLGLAAAETGTGARAERKP